MSQAPIYFEFPDSASAAIAFDTLSELGYHAHATGRGDKPGVQLYIDHNDLTSALEIAQANGGVLMNTETTSEESESYSMAYGLDSVPIPAHVVNEDWPESYYTSAEGGTIGSADESGADPGMFDPSGDDYDHFSAGVRL